MASSLAVFNAGVQGLLVPAVVFTITLALAFALEASDRNAALAYTAFFGALAGLNSLTFLQALDWQAAFPIIFIAMPAFFITLNALAGSTLEASVLEWHNGRARVKVKPSLHSPVKPGEYVVECVKKKTGKVTVEVQKSLFGNKPVRVLQ